MKFSLFLATVHAPGLWFFLPRSEMRADAGNLSVDGNSVVVETRRLQDDSGCPDTHGQSENPQKQSVKHHRDVLPVFFHLK